MKKTLISTLALFSMVAFAVNTVSAADVPDTDTQKSAKTQFTLSPSDNPGNAIRIEAVSDLTFEDGFISDEAIETQLTSHSILINEFSGQAPGWTLKAKVTPMTFKTPGDNGQPEKTVTLTGAQIKFDKPKYEKLVLTSDAAQPNPSQPLTLSEVPETLVQAPPGTAYGKWQVDYMTPKLTVPAGNIAGDYSGSIIYTLESTPIPGGADD